MITGPYSPQGLYLYSRFAKEHLAPSQIDALEELEPGTTRRLVVSRWAEDTARAAITQRWQRDKQDKNKEE